MMAAEEREHDDMQLEGASSDEEGNTTDTEVEDNGGADADDADADGGDETQAVAPPDTEIAPDEDAAHMMEEQGEDPVYSREAQAAEALGFMETDDGGREGNEPTQATQIDSPHEQAPTQQNEDSENTESLNLTPLESRSSSAGGPSAGGTVARRTPSPLRRNGRGSGAFLLRGGDAGGGGGGTAAAGDIGTSSGGFLSSAEPSAKAARAPAASSLSPHPLPSGWLDEKPTADRAAAAEGAQAQERPRMKMRAQPAPPGQRASTATTIADEGAAVPKKPSPAKAAADGAGWIRTRGSPSKGKGKKAPAAAAGGAGAAGDEEADEQATALDTQDDSVSQSILAIGVPHERRVLEQAGSRPSPAGGIAAAASVADQGEEEGEDDEEEEDMLAAVGATGGTVNSQELRADEFSQIRKGCSQEQHDFNRLLDDVIAGAAAENGEADQLSGALDEGSPLQAEPGSQGRGGGGSGGSGDAGRGGGGGKQKKMKKIGRLAAADGGGGGDGAKRPRGGGAGRTGAAGSRTPGAYVGGVGAKSSTKKRAAPSQQDNAKDRTQSVFDFPSDDDGSDGGDGAGGPSSAGRKRAIGVVSSNRSKGSTKKAKDTVVSKATQAARGDHDEKSGQQQQRQREEETEEEEEEEEEDYVLVDVRNIDADDDDRDGDDGDDGGDDEEEEEEEEDDQIVRTTQDVQMEKRMAAIRMDTSSVSAPEAEKEEKKEEEEEEEEDEEEKGCEDGERGKGREQDKGSRGGDTAAGEPSGAGRRERGAASRSNAAPKAGGRKRRKPKPCPPELLTYKAMESFLKNECWEIVDGKGLDTWFYLIPGKKGKNGKKGVDYFVSEKEVVQYVRNNEEALIRYEDFRKNPTTAAGRPAGGGASNGPAASRSDGDSPDESGRGGRGRRRSSSSSTESAARRVKKKARGENNAGSSANAEIAAGSAPAGQANGSRGQGGDQAAARPGKEKAGGETNAGSCENAETAAGSAPARQANGSGRQRSEHARGRRRRAENPPPPRSGRSRRHVGIDFGQKWKEEWPKLNHHGWHWEHGKMGCIYVADGFTKKTGTVGVNIFETREALLTHIFVQESIAAVGSSAGGTADSSAGGAAGSAPKEHAPVDVGGDASYRTGGGEPVVEWGLAKNRVRRTATDANSAAPEVLVLPGRRGGRKPARSPTPSAAEGGEPSSRPDDRRSTTQGGGADRPAPPAQGGNKRGRGRGAALAGGVKRGRAAGAKQPPAGTRDGARGDPGVDQRRQIESGEDHDDNHDDADDATQPQFELSSAINLTRWGNANPGASSAAVAASKPATGKGATASKTSEADLAQAASVAESKLPRPANGSPPASNGADGGGSGSGSDANGAASSAPKRKPNASSPPSSSSSVQTGGGAKRRKQGSPSRRTVEGLFSGLGVVVTGLRGDSRDKLVAEIEKLGGEIVNILGKTASAAKWRKWLLVKAALGCVGGRKHTSALSSDDGAAAKSEVVAKPDSANTLHERQRMIAVATPDSDRTPKFQLAMAAGMPIVHPNYVETCIMMATEVDTNGYLLPLGRSALLGRGLIMPHPSARGRPFQGKTILLCMHGPDAERQTLNNWVFTLGMAGAALKVLQQEGSGDWKGAGGGGGAAPGLGGAVDASWCTLGAALKLLVGGEVFCVIGPKRGDGDAVPASLVDLEDAAMKAGTPAGSLEWAIQCMAQGRFLLPAAGTCLWFPLGATAGGVDKKSSGRGGGGGGSRRRGRGAGRGGASNGGSSDVESRPFYVHVSDGKRYVSGDYVFLENEKDEGGASIKSGGAAADAADAAAATAAAAAAAAAGAVDAPSRRRVVRIISFRREADGKVKVAIIPMKRGDGEKVLENDEGKEAEVEDKVLGARVLGMTKHEMEKTQLYSLRDSGIFRLNDQDK
eukprot:g7445.t1